MPGGVAGVFAVRNAGLAISQGIWSSVIVLVSFVWGIFVFHEHVRSLPGTVGAVALFITGLCGMSYHAVPDKKKRKKDVVVLNYGATPSIPDVEKIYSTNGINSIVTTETDSLFSTSVDMEDASERYSSTGILPNPHFADTHEFIYSFGGLQITKFQLGYAAAVFNGFWAAMILIPLHFAG